jgi:hypothetical protein
MMLIDTRKDFEKTVLQADLCIIGAGAAGISIARSFANGPVRVCLLESGGLDIDADTQALYEGENVGLDYFALDATRLRFLGGSTNHWGGMCGPLWPIDFEDRDWVAMSGWPFDFEHLEPYYRSAQDVCELGPFDYGMEWLEDTLEARRLPLETLGFLSFPKQYSPPTKIGERYREELDTAPNVAILLYANVLRIDTNEPLRKQLGSNAGRSPISRFRSGRIYTYWPQVESRTLASCCCRTSASQPAWVTALIWWDAISWNILIGAVVCLFPRTP